jgi:hypothetical protein
MTDQPSSRVTELARTLLGIDDPARLAELEEYAPLADWIAATIPALQDAYPDEPPPAVQFAPGELARDFWRGVPGGA